MTLYPCRTCGKKFKYRESRKKHEVHCYLCNRCQRQFYNAKNLQVHSEQICEEK